MPAVKPIQIKNFHHIFGYLLFSLAEVQDLDTREGLVNYRRYLRATDTNPGGKSNNNSAWVGIVELVFPERVRIMEIIVFAVQ